MTFDNYKYARSLIILLNDRIQRMSIEILLNYIGKYLVLKIWIAHVTIKQTFCGILIAINRFVGLLNKLKNLQLKK